MRFRAGDILGIKALVEADRDVDALHDIGGSAGEAAAPHRIRLAHAGPPKQRLFEMKRLLVALVVALLPAALGGSAAAGANGMEKFIRAPEPRPAPDVG